MTGGAPTSEAGPWRLAPEDEQRLSVRFGDDIQDWLSELPDTIERFLAGWRLHAEPIVRAGGTSVVVRCREQSGSPQVLKLTPDPAIARTEACALALWAEARHVVDLIRADEQSGAILLEEVLPGEPLTRTGWAPAVIGFLLDELTSQQPLDEGIELPTVAERCTFIFNLTRSRRSRAAAAGSVSEASIDRAHEAALQIAESFAGAPRLVHGDLHPGNVLTGGAGRGLVAIDPRPCLGDPLFDLVDWILAEPVVDQSGLADRVAEFGRLLPNLDAERATAWAVVMAPVIATALLCRPTIDDARVRFLLTL